MSLLSQRILRIRLFLGLLLLLAVSEPLPAQPAGKKPSVEAQAAFARGREKMAAQDYTGAKALFQQAVVFSPEYLEAHMQLAAARRAAGDAAFFINRAQYEKVIELSPDYWPVYEALGRNCLEDGNTGCMRFFKEVVRLRPNHPSGYVGIARSILQNSAPSEIRERVREGAIPQLRKALSLDKQYAEAWRELGNAFVVLEQSDDALSAFEEAAVLEPKNPAAYLLAGNFHYSRQQYLDAFIAYTKAMLANPKHAATYSLRGRSEEASGDFPTAYEDYNTALGLDAADYLGRMGRGRIHRRQGRYSNAVNDFTAAIEAGSREDKLRARLERATTYRLAGQLESGRADAAQVSAEIEKSSPLYAAASVELGLYFEATRKYDSAKDMYEKALSVGEDAEVRAARNRVIAADAASRNPPPAPTYTPRYSPPAKRQTPTATTQRCNACNGTGKITYERLAVGGGLSGGGSKTYYTIDQYGRKTYGTSSGTESIKCTDCNGKGTVQGTSGGYYDDEGY